MKISIITEDDGWRESQGSVACVTVETDSQWVPMAPEYKMKEFMPTKLHELMITDSSGNFWRYVPEYKVKISYNVRSEAIGCTNELFYRNGNVPADIPCIAADYVRKTIERCLEEAYNAGKNEK